MKFSDAYRRTNDTVHVREDLLAEIKYKQALENTEKTGKRGLRGWLIALPTATAAVALAGVALFVGLRVGQRTYAAKTAEEAPYAGEAFDMADKAAEVVGNGAITDAADDGRTGLNGADTAILTVDSYDALAAYMNDRMSNSGYNGYYPGELAVEEPVAVAEADMPSDALDYTVASDMSEGVIDAVKGDSRSMYGTNVQVESVDEADIVKTDGKWIYCLNRTKNSLYVVSAEGKKTKVTASAALREGDLYFAERTASGDVGGWLSYNEMMLANDRLYVIGTSCCWGENVKDTNVTFVEIYELGDRTELKLVNTLKQEGSYRTARLIGDTLVLVSDFRNYYWVPVYDVEKIDDWCPRVWTDDAETPYDPGDIYINSDSNENGFTVITTIDTVSGTEFDSHKAVLGGCSVVYCNETDLLIASQEWERTQSDEQTDANGKHFVKMISHEYTSLCLFAIDGGDIVPKATQKVEGSLLNQFSMDADNGTYRLVVTRDGSEETIWTDGIDTYEYKQFRDCALYVLDGELNQIGILEKIAEDESVQSVRFMGDTAYFVTFRQVDPLFAVDLSDPTNPTILSALKIPGFSAYLHPFGKDRLIGIGYRADEKTGRTEGVKLSLFDISDPADVKEIATKSVDAYYTTLQYNHKAVFADPDKGVIAFPADSQFFVYRVSDKGFKEIGKIDIGEYSWDEDVRGVSIDEAFYVVSSDRVTVLSFDKMKKLTEVKFK